MRVYQSGLNKTTRPLPWVSRRTATVFIWLTWTGEIPTLLITLYLETDSERFSNGKADYIFVDDNGAVNLWHNRGSADTSMAIDGLRFADIDGDGVSVSTSAMAEIQSTNRYRLTTTFGSIRRLGHRVFGE